MSKLSSLTPLLLAALLAGGCYCPTLSGRFGQPGCFPPSCPQLCGCGTCDTCAPRDASSGDRACAQDGIRGFAGGRGLQGSGPVASNQGADYISPLPKFHPVPTRPVFEPVATYVPPVPLESPSPVHRLPH